MIEFAWWVYAIILFVLSFFIGIFVVMAGVGGGVLFTPIVGGFFPFHIDFVRGAGLFVALAGSIAASPGLLKRRLADIRLAMPFALVASVFSVIGAFIGLMIPGWIVQTFLGITIIGLSVLMMLSKTIEFPKSKEPDRLSKALAIYGIYYDESLKRNVEWRVQRGVMSLFVFALVGIVAGMFGLGAGWINVPLLSVFMGIPLKIAAGTSKFLISITDTAAAWVYLNNCLVIPLITIPSVLGVMVGSYFGVFLIEKASPRTIKITVVIILLIGGVRSFLKGMGVWT